MGVKIGVYKLIFERTYFVIIFVNQYLSNRMVLKLFIFTTKLILQTQTLSINQTSFLIIT